MKNFIIAALAILSLPVCLTAQTHTVTLKWSPSPTVGATYIVYRETSAGACPITSTGVVVAGCLKLTPGGIAGILTPCSNSTLTNCLSFVDIAPPQGETSFYVVRAFANNVESANSNEVAAAVSLPAPAPASNLTAIVN
jgi:hypothetical protein